MTFHVIYEGSLHVERKDRGTLLHADRWYQCGANPGGGDYTLLPGMEARYADGEGWESIATLNAKLRLAAVALVGILLAGAWAADCNVDVPAVSAAQNPMTPGLPPLPPPFGNGPPIGVDNNPEHKQIEQARNAQRQKQLVQDTDKLLALAQQLKDDVDKSNGSTLPIDAIKKAAQIEKLAKTVRSKIRS